MSTKKYKEDEALERLKIKFGSNLKLPRKIKFFLEENGTQCRIELNNVKVQTENMQTDANAFEGWAIALYIALGKQVKIILDVDEDFNEHIGYETNGHLGRFLYRALRFSQQYGEWFELSEQVNVAVDKFEEYLSQHCFTNNLAKGKAGIKESHDNENKVEAEFANKGIRKFILEGTDIGDNEVYRQLPVGLFRMKAGRTKGTYNCSKDTMVFTGGKSAIDLWTWQDKSFKVIELKTENPMIGIITEIFFYSNYMYDFLIREWKKDVGFKLNEPCPKNKDDRGYSNIKKGNFDNITGIMIADKYHPILENNEVIKVLKESACVNITYEKYHYKYPLNLV